MHTWESQVHTFCQKTHNFRPCPLLPIPRQNIVLSIRRNMIIHEPINWGPIDNCVMTILGRTFQASYILVIIKTIKQTVKPQIQKFSALLTHWIMKTPYSVLKMSTVSSDTSRETTTPLTDGCNNSWMLESLNGPAHSSFLHSTTSLCFSSARRH